MINGSLLLPIPTYLFVDRASLTQLIDLDECTPTLDKLAFCFGLCWCASKEVGDGLWWFCPHTNYFSCTLLLVILLSAANLMYDSSNGFSHAQHDAFSHFY